MCVCVYVCRRHEKHIEETGFLFAAILLLFLVFSSIDLDQCKDKNLK